MAPSFPRRRGGGGGGQDLHRSTPSTGGGRGVHAKEALADVDELHAVSAARSTA